jgi:hypothetical protein
MRSPAEASRLSPAQGKRWAVLEQKIRRYSDLLVDQGTLASRVANGKRVWSLRLYEKTATGRVQRAIYLGADTDLVQRAQQLLDEFRFERRVREEVAVLCRLSGTLAWAVRRC